MYIPDPLDTLRDMLQLFHVRLHLFREPYENLAEIDFHLREDLFEDYDYLPLIKTILASLQPGQTQTYRDIFGNFYVAFSLFTEDMPSPYEFALIGPFKYHSLDTQALDALLAKYNIPHARRADLVLGLSRVPVIQNRELWVNMEVYLISRLICKDRQLDYRTPIDMPLALPELTALISHDNKGSDAYQANTLAGGYHLEEELLNAVKRGNVDQSTRIALKFVNFQIAYHSQFGLPEYYAFIELNALLRRAAIESGVHVLRLDETFVHYNRFICQKEREKETIQLTCTDMAADYCKLIKRYSRKNFSTLVRKCLDYMDFHFQETVSLHTLAQMFNVSNGHLSTLFHKEVGIPLTDYLNQNRVQYAKTLLETSELSMQEISSVCGFSDASYFTRIFKKYTGKSPKQYRADRVLL